MIKNISKYSPIIGLALLIIAINFDFLNIFRPITGGDGASRGIEYGVQRIGFIAAYIHLY